MAKTGAGRKRAVAKHTARVDSVDRAIAKAVQRARRQAAAEGLLVPVQRLGDRVVRWIKPWRPKVRIGEAGVKDVNVTELRRNLHTYLDKVRRGQRIKVTTRGMVIAEIVPPNADKADVDTARARLRGSMIRYDCPLEPALESLEWEMNR
jgi:prevent-host-death family protein